MAVIIDNDNNILIIITLFKAAYTRTRFPIETVS